MTQAEVEPTDEGVGADELILQYRKVRAKIEAMDAQHADAVKPYKEVLDMLKEELRRILDEAGADSCKTEYGTAYKSIKTNVKTLDKRELVCAVLAEATGDAVPLDVFERTLDTLLDSLDIKPNKTFIEDKVTETGEQFPGTEISRYIDINVRK
jgi:hypothetical protein